MVNVVGWAVPGSDDAGKGSAVGKFLCRRRALPAELLDSDGQAPLQCIHFDLSVAKHIQVPDFRSAICQILSAFLYAERYGSWRRGNEGNETGNEDSTGI